jgi:hypothetical protein
MNYVQVPTKGEDADRLVAALPQLRGHYYDQREWTIRRRVSKDVPVPTQPTVFTPPDSYPGDRYFEARRDEDDPWDIFPGPSYFPTGDGFFFTSLQFAPTKLPPQLVQSSADCAGPWSKMFAPESCFVECCRRKKAFIKGLDMSIEKVIDSALAFQRFWWWASRMDELLTFLRDFARTAARRLDFGAPSKGIGGLEAAPFLF